MACGEAIKAVKSDPERITKNPKKKRDCEESSIVIQDGGQQVAK